MPNCYLVGIWDLYYYIPTFLVGFFVFFVLGDVWSHHLVENQPVPERKRL